MSRNLRFWLNFALIGLAHVVVIGGLVRWSRETKVAKAQSIVWMSGGDANAAPPKPVRISTPAPEETPEPKDEPDNDQPDVIAAKSEIQLPVATPTPSPRSTSTPRPSPSPKVKVSPPKATPKPKPTAKPTPKPSPKKLVIAKASPKPKPTPEETKPKDDVDLAKEPEKQTEETPKPVASSSGGNKGTSGSGGRIGGPGGQSQFGWYGSMLHDRFYSEWVQPTTIASSGAKNSVLVKLRIEKDGRVSTFEIVRPSGNDAVDASVAAAAKRVTKVDPLPEGLGNGEHYDVKINFELNSE